MEKLKIKLIIWAANKLGFKIAMVRITGIEHSIQGNIELIKYLDVVGYTFKKEPLKREFKN